MNSNVRPKLRLTTEASTPGCSGCHFNGSGDCPQSRLDVCMPTQADGTSHFVIFKEAAPNGN